MKNMIVQGHPVALEVIDSALESLRGHGQFNHATIRRILEDRGVPSENEVSYRAADRVTKLLVERRLAYYEVSPKKRWLWRRGEKT